MRIDDGVSSLVEINRKAVVGKQSVCELRGGGGSHGRSRGERVIQRCNKILKTKGRQKKSRLCLMEVKVGETPPQKKK